MKTNFYKTRKIKAVRILLKLLAENIFLAQLPAKGGEIKAIMKASWKKNREIKAVN